MKASQKPTTRQRRLTVIEDSDDGERNSVAQPSVKRAKKSSAQSQKSSATAKDRYEYHSKLCKTSQTTSKRCRYLKQRYSELYGTIEATEVSKYFVRCKQSTEKDCLRCAFLPDLGK